jgi:hypothetical protein
MPPRLLFEALWGVDCDTLLTKLSKIAILIIKRGT